MVYNTKLGLYDYSYIICQMLTKTASSLSRVVLPHAVWTSAAAAHREIMTELLYPTHIDIERDRERHTDRDTDRDARTELLLEIDIHKAKNIHRESDSQKLIERPRDRQRQRERDGVSPSLPRRKHLVHYHPVYNFLHRYYRFKTHEVLNYSPGMDFSLSLSLSPSLSLSSNSLVDSNVNTYFLSVDEEAGVAFYDPRKLLDHWPAVGRHGSISLRQNHDILRKSSRKSPFLACFGMHEWAMLYSGRKSCDASAATAIKQKHQEGLRLRVAQSVIDDVVEASGIRCTHFDAWRFFQPDAQPLNIYNPMKRKDQQLFEQPGCIHANMDLFRFAYQLSPFVSSELLVKATKLAIRARCLDMRASPYDVSMFPECSDPLFVETSEGKKKFVCEQELLSIEALPIRTELLAIYNKILGF